MPKTPQQQLADFEERLSQLELQGGLKFPLAATEKSVFEGEFSGLINQDIYKGLYKTYTVGEPMTVPQAVYVEDVSTDIKKLDVGQSGSAQDLAVGGDDSTTPSKEAMSFQETLGFILTKVTVELKKIGTPVDTLQISIQADNAGAPSGTVLTSATIAPASLTTSYAEYTLTLAPSITIEANTRYWIVAERTGVLSNVNRYGIQAWDGGAYATGNTSTYKGGWVANTATSDMAFELITTTTAGIIYLATALTAAQATAFIGFNQSDVELVGNAVLKIGEQVTVQIQGQCKGFTGLTTGSTYFLSDTYGAIGTSAGTVTRKVGIATSATTLLLTNIF